MKTKSIQKPRANKQSGKIHKTHNNKQQWVNVAELKAKKERVVRDEFRKVAVTQITLNSFQCSIAMGFLCIKS